jgi:hypothetical protein
MGGRIMNDKGRHCELRERVTTGDRLASSIEFAAKAMTVRLGYEVEVSGLVLIDRDGKQNLLVFWRRKRVVLRVVAGNVEPRRVTPGLTERH